jgi:monovalent cation:H+ antiporter, CPA1 family
VADGELLVSFMLSISLLLVVISAVRRYTNDATGVISFNVVRGIIFSRVAFSLLDVSISFIWSMVGAIALGTAIGWVGGKVLDKWKADEYVDFTFSLGLAISGYIVADHFLHVSGVVTTLFIALLLITKHRDFDRC